MTWLTAVLGAAAGILAGVGGMAKLRPERHKLDADAALAMQKATHELVSSAEESIKQARSDARDAQKRATAATAEADDAKRVAAEARAELHQIREELLQARAELAQLRQSAADERAAAAGREAISQATIRGLSMELQMARLGGGANGTGGLGAA